MYCGITAQGKSLFFCNKPASGTGAIAAGDFATGGACQTTSSGSAATPSKTDPYAGLRKTGTCSSANVAGGCCFDPCAYGYCGTGAECVFTAPTSSIAGIHADPPTAHSGDEVNDDDKFFGYAKELSTSTIVYGKNDGLSASSRSTAAPACGDATTKYKWIIGANSADITFSGTLDTTSGTSPTALVSPAIGALAAFASTSYPKCRAMTGYYPMYGTTTRLPDGVYLPYLDTS